MLNVNGQFNFNNHYYIGDKSISHRSLILASIANGESEINNLSLCQDVLTTADCLRALGANITIDGTTAFVTPIQTPKSSVALDCKNSGTTARLLAGLVSGLGVSATFIGDKSLSCRPMDRVIEPLKKLGAKIRKTDNGLFAIEPSKLVGCEIVSEVNSAQVKSAVLLAGLFAEGETTYVEKFATRNHTEILLKYYGADITADGNRITVKQSRPSGLYNYIPNDPSSQAYLIALALLTKKEITIHNVLMNERRLGFITSLLAAGANIVFDNAHKSFGENVASITVKTSVLKPLFADKQVVCDAIDEVPLLAAIAIASKGKHVFESVSELRHKECDRIQAIIHMATVCGQIARMEDDNLVIESNGILPSFPFFSSYNDHRIAMCETILAIISGGGSVDEAPFEISFPNFLSSIGVEPVKLGLIGGNVEDSKSPILMSCLAQNAQICCSYERVSLNQDLSDDQLLNVISSFDGLNVTMPFKRRVATLLKAKYPSVNTIGKNIEPCSTDGYGIVQSLFTHNVDISNKDLWIVGAGGAAEECICTLLELDCAMQVINRTASHAEELTQKYNLARNIDAPYGILSFVPECDFEKQIIIPPSCQFIFVAAYKGGSGLKKQALERNITYIDGLEMLYHQGSKSFSLWTKTEIQNDFKDFCKHIGEK